MIGSERYVEFLDSFGKLYDGTRNRIFNPATIIMRTGGVFIEGSIYYMEPAQPVTNARMPVKNKANLMRYKGHAPYSSPTTARTHIFVVVVAFVDQ